jgi:hypothetical protein
METLPAPPPLESHGEWLRAYQEAQRQTAEAHAAYQRAMAETHMAFLRTAETSFAGLSALLGGQPVATAPSTISQQPAGAVVVPAVFAAPVVAPACRASEHADRRAHARIAGRRPASDNGHARPAAPVAPEPPRAALEPAATAVDLEALLMSVVADKTGYPAEMLAAHMDLEADLGIDSIKRVEILAAFRERAPGLPEVEPTELGRLRTLGQIVEHMRALQAAPASHPANGHAAGGAVAGAAAPAAAPASLAVPREVPALAVAWRRRGSTAPPTWWFRDGGGLAARRRRTRPARVKARVASEVPPGAGAGSSSRHARGRQHRRSDRRQREAFRAARRGGALRGGGLFATGRTRAVTSGSGAPACGPGRAASLRARRLEWPHAP